MKNIGIDLGAGLTKTSEGFKCQSKIQMGFDPTIEKEMIHKVIYDKKTFTVGDGNSIMTKEKYFTEQYKIILLTAIAKSMENTIEDINLTIGVPADLFKNKAFISKIEEHIKDYGRQQIIVDNVDYVINIENVNIWAESFISIIDFENFNKVKATVIDIGTYTVDVMQMNEGSIVGSHTFELGISKLEEDLLREINSVYETNITDKSGTLKKLLDNKAILINDEETDIQKFSFIIESYLINLLSNINTMFTLDDTRVIFIGGGTQLLKNHIKTHFGERKIYLLDNAEFINAKAFKVVSETKSILKN